MILLGLLLMAGCAALAVDAVVQNTGAIHAIVFNQSVTHLSLGAVFVAGAVVGLLFALGLLMFTGGIGRAGRKRRERKLAARKADAETQALREHNDRLAAELEQERSSSTYPAEDTTTTTADERLSGRHRAH
jgi:hypothetical protein